MQEAQKQFSKREKILEAALSVFTKEGFYNAKIEDIAQTAGVGKGTIYEYFKSKQELFQEMVKSDITSFIADVGDSVEKRSNPKEKLLTIALLHREFFLRSGDITQLLASCHQHLDKSFLSWTWEIQFEKLVQFQRIIEEGQKEGVFRKNLDPVLSAKLINGGILSLFAPAMHGHREQLPGEAEIGALFEILYEGMKG